MSTFSFPPRGLCIYCHLTPSSRLKFSGSTVAGSLPENKQKVVRKRVQQNYRDQRNSLQWYPKNSFFIGLSHIKKVLLVHYFKQRRCQLNIYYVGTYATVGQDQFSNFRGGYHLSTQAVTIFNKLKF